MPIHAQLSRYNRVGIHRDYGTPHHPWSQTRYIPGRISRAGVYPLSWTLDSVGFFTRSAEDIGEL